MTEAEARAALAAFVAVGVRVVMSGLGGGSANWIVPG